MDMATMGHRRRSSTMGRSNEKDLFIVYEDEFHHVPPKKRNSKTPRPMYLLLATSAALLFSIGAVFAWIWHLRATALLSTSVDPIDSSAPGHWVSSWTAAQQAQNTTEAGLSISPEDNYLSNITIRQTLLMSLGGDRLRLRFSNAFGATPLRLESVTIALPEPEHASNRTSGAGRVRLDTLVRLTFGGGASGVTIPPHGLAVSDVVPFKIGAQEVLTVSVFLNGEIPETLSGHRISRTTSTFCKGDHTASFSLRNAGELQTETDPSWFVVSAIDAWQQSKDHRAVAMVGDSITDGRSATLNANCRYPDFLFQRMQRTDDKDLKALSVVNLGIGGNQLLGDGVGPNLISRLDRDVLAVSGIKYAMVLEATNDINHSRGTFEEQMANGDDIIVQLQQVVIRLHAAGIVAFGGTVLPFSCTDGLDPNNHANDPVKEQLRLKLNSWIRNSGTFDAVVDFDRWLRDPKNHTEMAPQLRSDDCEHPSDAGFREMAERFPLDIFARFKDGLQLYSP